MINEKFEKEINIYYKENNFIIEYVVFKDSIHVESIESFHIMLFPSSQQIWFYQGDTSQSVELEDFICIKDKKGNVLYTKKELKKRVLPEKEIENEK